jgi:hypothetical protein
MAYALRRNRRATATGSTVAGPGWRPRRGGASRSGGAAGGLLLTLARVVRFAVGVIVAIIVAAIVLRLLGANPANAVVRHIHNWGHTLVGPFNTLFSIHKPKLAITVNWGVAALVWCVVGGIVASLLTRMGAGATAR